MRHLSADLLQFHDLVGEAVPPPGTNGDDNLKGTSDGDYIEGLDGNDTLNGLGGDDVLQGGGGNDSLIGGSGDDALYDEQDGSDTLLGGTGADYIEVNHFVVSGTSEHILIDGGDDADDIHLDLGQDDGGVPNIQTTILGGGGDDVVHLGNVGHVTVDAGAGDDQVSMVLGQDVTVTLGQGADVVGFIDATGTSVLTITDFSTGDAGDALDLGEVLGRLIAGWDHENPFGDGHLRLVQRGGDTVLQLDANGGGDSWSDIVLFQGADKTSFTAFNLGGLDPDGSALAGEHIVGTTDGDFLEGTNGADTIEGLGGSDNIYGDDGADSLLGGDGDDYLYGGFGPDTLNGGAGNDTLASDDADRLIGGDGDDQFTINAATATGTANLDGGQGDDSINIQFDTDAPLKVVAKGGDGDDQFTVEGAGSVSLYGGAGDDHFTLTDAGQHVTLSLGDGADTVRLDNDFRFEPVTVTITDFQAGAGGDSLDLYDFLAGRLEGWDGSSNPFGDGYLRLTAKGGDTVLQYHPTADGGWQSLVVLKGVAAGQLVAANLSGYPADGGTPVGLNIKGTAGDDVLHGTNLYDTISGGVGDDSIDGGAGDDVLSGGKGSDTMEGGLGANRLVGGAGDDLLYGSMGLADTLLGAAGDDTLIVDRGGEPPVSGGVTSMDGGGGADYIEYSGDFSINERVFADGGVGNDTMVFDSRGTDSTVTIEGGAGDDQISLAYGAFTVDAGDGDDRISLDPIDPGTRITLGAGADSVLIQSVSPGSAAAEITDFTSKDVLDLSNFSGGSDPFEDGTLRLVQDGDTAVVMFHMDLSWQALVRLDGVDAADLSAKQLGGFGPGAVWLMGTDGNDHLTATTGLTHLDGLAGDDVLKGSGAADVLVGGTGADTLTGGGGADTFVYQSFIDSGDTITDLTNADVIDLSGIDADFFLGGDQAFVLVSAFDGNAGELTVTKSGKTTLIQGDLTGDQVADFTIVVSGDHHDFTNFVL